MNVSVPLEVKVSMDEEEEQRLDFGCATPGTMAQTKEFCSPLGLFSGENRKLFDESSSIASQSTALSSKQRLGIMRPSYRRSNSKKNKNTSSNSNSSIASSSRATTATGASARIGINRTDYQLPDGEMPLSPIQMYLNQKKNTSPAPNLVEAEDAESPSSSTLGDIDTTNWKDNLAKTTPVQSLYTRSMDDDMSHDDSHANNDNVARMLHKQTAQGHYLVNSRPLAAPAEKLKFSLTKGRKSLTKEMKLAAESRATRPNVVNKKAAVPTNNSDTAFKVFLLLIEPKAKIFEIIQVLYSPSVTTVGDILEMISCNATEPALGSQPYAGLCRPNEDILIDLNFMASAACPENDACARITRGEILVAVPKGYSAPLCSKLAKPILSNKRVSKLLDRSDPLSAPSKKQKRKSRRSKARNYLSVDATIDEEYSSPQRKKHDEAVSKALRSAALAAATSNAESNDCIGLSDDDSALDFPSRMWRTSSCSQSTISRQDSMTDNSSIGSESDTDSSFLSHLKRMPRRRARKNRRLQQQKLMKRVGAVIFSIMVLWYLLFRPSVTITISTKRNNMLGLMGLFQVAVTFIVILKTQRYMQGHRDMTKCPFVSRAQVGMKRFR